MSSVSATHHGDVAVKLSGAAPKVRQQSIPESTVAFAFHQRIVAGALCGVGVHLLATMGWTTFFAMGWPAMLLFLPQALGFAIAGGWVAILHSLSEWTERDA